MAKFNPFAAKHSVYKKIAASATTGAANVSVVGDGCRGNDFLERVIVISASTALPGAVTVLDGDTVILTHNAQLTGYTQSNVVIYDIGCLSDSTKGFNITTGTSVTAVAIGRF